jgi:hypothetical protein
MLGSMTSNSKYLMPLNHALQARTTDSFLTPLSRFTLYSVPKAKGVHINIHMVDLLGVWCLSHPIALKETLFGL